MKCKSGKTTYGKRELAWRKAMSFRKKFDNIHSPYKCKHCGKFHLTTQSKMDPPAYLLDKSN